jgi:hypothetical protein
MVHYQWGMYKEGKQFSWRQYRSMISANSELMWEKSVDAHRPTGRIPRSILEMAGKLMIVMILDFAERYVSASLFDDLSRKTDGVAA